MAMTSVVPVHIPVGNAGIDGDLFVPARPSGLIVFAHGSGSSRHSPRNVFVADTLRDARFGTLLLDLLTPSEEVRDLRTREFRFDIDRLAGRVVMAIDWLRESNELARLPIACFGASTGAAAALIAAAERPSDVKAVISRGGRPDLAGDALPRVVAPTLLIVGGDDDVVIGLNEAAMRRMTATVKLEIIPGATHLFEEPGTLEQVAHLAVEWCRAYVANERATLVDHPVNEAGKR